MQLKILMAILVLLFVLLLPQEVTAAEVHYIKIFDGEETWGVLEVLPDIPAPCESSEAQKNEQARKLFQAMFDSRLVSFKPDNVLVLGATIEDEVLRLNLSKEILNYGGAYYEERLTEQLKRTALSIDGVSKLILLIEGEEAPLSEGTEVY